MQDIVELKCMGKMASEACTNSPWLESLPFAERSMQKSGADVHAQELAKCSDMNPGIRNRFRRTTFLENKQMFSGTGNNRSANDPTNPIQCLWTTITKQHLNRESCSQRWKTATTKTNGMLRTSTSNFQPRRRPSTRCSKHTTLVCLHQRVSTACEFVKLGIVSTLEQP